MSKRPISPISSFRCLLIFQLKLAADALRDLVMSPVSIVMFLLDILLRPPENESHYKQMMIFGRKSDRWINLFEEHSNPADISTNQHVEKP